MLSMNSAMTFEISTSSSAATQAVAHHLAPALDGGDVLELVSDLGGGKTTFTQGLAKALGYTGPVTSPTFALSQIYQLSSELELHHYDLYRLGAAGVLGDELAEDLRDPHVITVIEWPALAEPDLPADHLRIEFTVTGESDRRINFTAGGTRSGQLIAALQAQGAHQEAAS
jgi:tRNA threonylcarbamoyladenosine biosynthesis protein TsaE